VGKVAGGATTALMQGMVLMVLAFLPMFLGFSLDTLWKVLALIPIISLLAVAMTSLGVVVAARMRSFEGFPIIMNFILMPLFFLSGAMFPLQGLPTWMDILTKLNPLTYGVDALRGICLKGTPLAEMLQVPRYPLWLDLLVIMGFTVVLLALAIWQFGKQD